MTPADDPTAPAPLSRTLSLVRPATGRTAVATVLGAASVGAAVALLATSAWMIARASQQPSIAALGLAVVGVRLFAISRGLLRYGERLVGHDAALRSLADQRVSVYEHLEPLAPAGLPAFRRGDLLARTVDDVDALQDVPVRVVPPAGIAALVGTAVVIAIALVLPAASIVLAAGLAAASTLVPLLTQRLAHRREARQAAARGELSTAVVDLLEGAADLVAFGAVGSQLQRIAEADAELTGVAAATAGTTGVGAALTTLLTGLAVWGTVLVGVPAVASGRLAGPMLAVVVLTPLAAFEAVAGLPVAAQVLERVRRSAARLLVVLDAQPPVTEPDVPAVPPAAPVTLSLRGVRARYAASGPWALDGVDLDVAPGRHVAVVGPSGAGKSTLAAVLLRFVPYEAGSVRLGGTELDRLAGDDVRCLVGLAEQRAHVFDTTLRENLLLARPGAGDQALRDALGRARLLDWVDELPLGLDTPVGEHGAHLSGGQRQRLTVARALLAGFPILVLDEPGEHLDTPTADALVADALAATADRSVVLITHRLAGLDAVDEVVVLDHGRVVERGTHTALLAAGGRYAQLWAREQAASS